MACDNNFRENIIKLLLYFFCMMKWIMNGMKKQDRSLFENGFICQYFKYFFT